MKQEIDEICGRISRTHAPTPGQRLIMDRIASSMSLIGQHADLELLDHVREVIPVDRLHDAALVACERKCSDFQLELLKQLMDWWKSEVRISRKPCCCNTSRLSVT